MSISSISSSTDQISLAKMYQEMFKKVDTNSDGSIDKTEFAAAGPSQATSTTDETSKIDEMFSQIDTDGDGSISEEESETFLTKAEEERASAAGMQESASASELRQKLFDSLDTNSDGSIDKTEFAAAAPPKPPSTTDETDEADGTDETEETDETDKIFSEIDTNGDGSISEAEMEAYQTKMDEAKGSEKAPPPPPDWQTNLVQSMFADASSTETQSSTSVSLYV